MKPADQPRRVLMTTDTIGGVWTYCIELCAGLCERGVDVLLAAMGEEPSERQREQAARIDGLELVAKPFALEWMEDPWEDIAQASLWLSQLADDYVPDLVHLNTLAHGTLPWDAPVLSVGHSCVLSWFDAVKGEPAPDGWAQYRDVVRSSLKASDMVVAPSATMLQALQKHYGPIEHTRVVYNGRNPADFAPDEPEPGVLTAGRLWDEAKNVHAVAQAAGDIEWPVYVAGSDTHPDGGSVEFDGVEPLGRLDADEMANWYGRSMIYALPARYEPFGLTALEAALAGNALVLGDIGTLREIWGDAATFVDPERPDELAEAVNELVADADKRRAMAEQAKSRATQLTAEAMVDRYLEIYREMSTAALSNSTPLSSQPSHGGQG